VENYLMIIFLTEVPQKYWGGHSGEKNE
jgi:hypothetical protein